MPVELQIGSVLIAPVIVALIEVAKAAGLPGKAAPWLNGVLSAAGYGLMLLVQGQPGLLEPVSYALNALVIFLVAAGFYDRVQGIIARSYAKS